MVSRRTTWLQQRAVLAFAWMALVVLGLGLPRALVVCTQPCCAGHVKLTRACEAMGTVAALAVDEVAACGCCVKRGGRQPGDGERNDGRDCGGCVHVALGVEIGLPPAPVDVHADPATFARAELLALAPPWPETGARWHLPSTGPPRCDRRSALRAGTVLRI